MKICKIVNSIKSVRSTAVNRLPEVVGPGDLDPDLDLAEPVLGLGQQRSMHS